MVIGFCDFVPHFEIVSRETFFSAEVEKVATFEAAVDAANDFIQRHGVKVIQIETVVLPNLWDEGGSRDVALTVRETQKGNWSQISRWHQFIRVWYDATPRPDPYR